ncbi:MAG: hypothetical protein JSW54_13145 [Fidelibacterota bacterium]|nr:MAG: hypothetical protein JSW54_13145 [Candidatus Neomarinimicrobiota bacterium]
MPARSWSQEWEEGAAIPLPIPFSGLAKVAAAPWGEDFYFLDDQALEVAAIDREGRRLNRYGGWGTGSLSLDMPVCLALAENSVFVLDQGKYQILRLDARLNPIVTTPLPADWLPLTFIRDARQRFWIAFEGQSGLYLYDDEGVLVDVVADEASGTAVVLQPTLLAVGSSGVAVLDPFEAVIYLFHLSGQPIRRLAITARQPVLSMVWAGDKLLLTTGNELLEVDLMNGRIGPLHKYSGVVDLAYRFPTLFGLDPTGILRVFRPSP